VLKTRARLPEKTNRRPSAAASPANRSTQTTTTASHQCPATSPSSRPDTIRPCAKQWSVNWRYCGYRDAGGGSCDDIWRISPLLSKVRDPELRDRPCCEHGAGRFVETTAIVIGSEALWLEYCGACARPKDLPTADIEPSVLLRGCAASPCFRV
jgi:hypothetical protein